MSGGTGGGTRDEARQSFWRQRRHPRRGMGECAKNMIVLHAEAAVNYLRVSQSGTVVFARRQ